MSDKLTIESHVAGSKPLNKRSTFQRIKTAITIFFIVTAIFGLIIAAVVLGSVLGVVFVVLALVLLVAWLVKRLWRNKL